jgi:transglutaminase-like putative cysteine protease
VYRGTNPVAIYNWARNNVQWQPTWGAIQDASHTLSSQTGNASDIASLTISLLRASGIPARYVHGTIDVPADGAWISSNW